MQATYLAGLLGATALGVTVGLGVSAHPLQETRTEPARGTQEAAADEIDPWMAAMQRAGAVGEHHRMLAPMVGEFTAAMSYREPDGSMTESTGTWSAKWVMGDRFVEGTFGMNFEGMPFEGRSLIGYSNLEEAYESIWFDNMSTNIYYSGGFSSEDGKTITFLGADVDPMTGEMKESQSVYEIQDEDHFTYTSYLSTDSVRGDMEMQIHYTRR